MSSDFLRFRRMITPIIIEAIFWIGAIASVVLLREYVDLPLAFALIVGPLAVRVWCEFLILFFRMNETLTDLRNILQGMATSVELTERAAMRITHAAGSNPADAQGMSPLGQSPAP